MRVAGSTISRNYVRHLERNLASKYSSENKITSYRQFSRASECPAQAASAMRVRKALANLDTYQTNLKTADTIYSSAESSVMQISELIQSTYEKLIEGANGTHTEDQMEILAQTVDSYADEMTRLMNLTVADRKIFGGTNNATNAWAITTSVGGSKTVTYNGVAVNTYSDPTLFPNSETSYCDIGLGMTLQADGTIDPQSALALTFNGAEVLGCGVAANVPSIDFDSIENGTEYTFTLSVGSANYDVTFTGGSNDNENLILVNNAISEAVGNDSIQISTASAGIVTSSSGSSIVINTDSDLGIDNYQSGYSNNVIQNLLDAAQALRDGDGTAIAKFADQVYSLQTTVSLSLAKIGNTEEFIEFNQERLTNNVYSLTERQNDLESTDLASESTNWKVLESIYDATLQMSSSVIPQSIFEFL